ncbi:MAG: DUF1549 domain-containing protein [Planctomycetes bacterium]|nr:DUF1549 domain-containing protein [Planctomycetota bacterium]
MIRSHGCLFLLVAAVLIPASIWGQEEISPSQLDFFEKKIRPVLVERCYSCHSKGAKSIKGALVLDTRDGIRRGGDSGHAVMPGEVESSLLMEAIRFESLEMPPDEQLPAAVIADFAKWIEMGAPDPREGPSLIKREINFAQAKHHWSFQPIRAVEPPAVKNANWPRSAVDQFVLAKLEAKGLKPVGDVERVKLVRRLYYDLIGLPPTPDQLASALANESAQAIENLVDQLLDSPQFGERWGRHWLDVVRYAESNGRERNYVYPHAWRYRDYVIAAFNADKPFGQFIREQIAGDLIEDSGNEQLIATGFLAIGPKLLNERNKEVFRMDIVDDQIDVTTRAFMALTASCARCHDHKFDPIPTSEYYSLAGIFRSSETLFGTEQKQGNRQGSELYALGESPEYREHQERIAGLQKELRQAQAQVKKTAKKKPPKGADANERQAAVKENRAELAKVRKRIKALQVEIKQANESNVEPPVRAMGVREGDVTNSPIYIRGEVTSPKGKSPRGLLTILDDELQQPLLDVKQSGRLELAEWIASSENSLTTRVLVNRVWHHLFGYGLVRTVDNFGATGETPTHPGLLDHLATRFAEQGWSVKKLIRDLVLTRTYQLSGEYNADNYGQDPDNFLLWRHSPQRVDAEALRDAMLLASGTLNLSPGEGSPVSRLKGEFGRGVSIDQLAADNDHRSVYLPIVRNAVPEALQLFDFAEPSILVGERPVTTVPTQALYFMNSEFVTQQSDRLAESIAANEELDADGRIDLAYRTILSRSANGSEIERASTFIQQTTEQLVQSDGQPDEASRRALSAFCQALFGSAEFRYVE